ncbi:MAG: diphthine synthase [Candidatus Woesearchaeota archaeon]
MALFMIGIGLNDEKDISVKGLELVKKCSFIYLENYTSILQVSVERLEAFYAKPVMAADRVLVENNAEEMLDKAEFDDVAFLVAGDVFGATTHVDLYLRAKERGIAVHVVFNASVLNAVSITGLELYKFGKTTSLPFWTDSFKPETAYDVIKENLERNAHTLVLLDIKRDENEFMTANQAVELLSRIEQKRKEGIFTSSRKIIGCARLGGDNVVFYGRPETILELDFGEPPHCIIIPAQLHFMEEEMLGRFNMEQ